jgi:hypothetical protein
MNVFPQSALTASRQLPYTPILGPKTQHRLVVAAILLAAALLPVGATAETLTISKTTTGVTPAALGYNLGHFMPSSNAADWFRYSGVNAARVFISTSDIEPGDDLAPVGDGVTSAASFFARKALVREQSASTTSELQETYIKWSAFLQRYNAVLAGSNSIHLSYTMGQLRDRKISVLANITASASRFPITSDSDWAGKWELWQHYYAQAFLLSRDYGVGNFAMYNEPNGVSGIAEALWIQRLYYCSDAIQSAVADMNARYGKQVVAKVFAPNTANGVEKYNTAPDNIWGRDAVTHRHLRLDGASSPDWMNLHVYNYQKYTMLTHASGGLTGYVTDYNALRAAIDADMVGEPQLPMALSEFNVRTAANYENKTETQDSPSDYSALGANSIALTQCGAQQLYLFKFGQTASNAASGIAKNGTHYVQNDASSSHNYGGATKAAEVYRLFVKASGKNRSQLKTTVTAGAVPINTANLWCLATHAPDKGSYFIYLVNKGTTAISLQVNVADLALPDGAPVMVEDVSTTTNGSALTSTAITASTVPALNIPGQSVRLYTLPINKQYRLTTTAVADATLSDGANRSSANGSGTTLPVRADGTANGRKVALIKVPVPAADLASTHSHWLSLSVATASGSTPVQAHVYGLSDNTWTEASANWAGFGTVLKQNVGDGNLIENNVIAGPGDTAQLLGQITATTTTPATRYVDVTDFIKSRTDGFASFLIVQEHRWDVSQPALNIGDTQPAGLLVKSREAGSGAPGLLTLTPGTAPAVSVPPQSQSVFEGHAVTLSVTVSGSPPLSYAWFKNDIAIAGATGASLTLDSFQASDAGTYSVTIGNYAGSVKSTSAALTFVGNGLIAFRSANGLAANSSQDRGSSGDGVSYLAKYAFNMLGNGEGQAPTLTTPNTAKLTPSGRAGLPAESVDGSGRLKLAYIRRKAALNPGVTYSLEFSSNLTDWTVNPGATELVAAVDTALERVTATDSLPVATWGKRFVRLRVTAQ